MRMTEVEIDKSLPTPALLNEVVSATVFRVSWATHTVRHVYSENFPFSDIQSQSSGAQLQSLVVFRTFNFNYWYCP